MKTLVEGHRYVLDNFISGMYRAQEIQFIHKESDKLKPDELRLVSDGTTNEEVLKVLINRIKFLDDKMPSIENARAIVSLKEALSHLESRTSERKARGVEGTHKP